MRSSLLLTSLFVIGCSQLKPEKVAIQNYHQIDALFSKQHQILGSSLTKQVTLDEESESRTLTMDSSAWKTELQFLDEINPSRPEYVGAFKEEIDGSITSLILGPQEKGSLKRFSFRMMDGAITNVTASLHEDKDVFVHHKEVSLSFDEDKLTRYWIEGYQKILLKDTIFFSIKGQIN